MAKSKQENKITLGKKPSTVGSSYKDKPYLLISSDKSILIQKSDVLRMIELKTKYHLTWMELVLGTWLIAWHEYEIQVTNQQIATELKMNPLVVSQCLQSLQTKGFIKLIGSAQSRRIIIL